MLGLGLFPFTSTDKNHWSTSWFSPYYNKCNTEHSF